MGGEFPHPQKIPGINTGHVQDIEDNDFKFQGHADRNRTFQL